MREEIEQLKKELCNLSPEELKQKRSNAILELKNNFKKTSDLISNNIDVFKNIYNACDKDENLIAEKVICSLLHESLVDLQALYESFNLNSHNVTFTIARSCLEKISLVYVMLDGIHDLNNKGEKNTLETQEKMREKIKFFNLLNSRKAINWLGNFISNTEEEIQHNKFKQENDRALNSSYLKPKDPEAYKNLKRNPHEIFNEGNRTEILDNFMLQSRLAAGKQQYYKILTHSAHPGFLNVDIVSGQAKSNLTKVSINLIQHVDSVLHQVIDRSISIFPNPPREDN